MMENTNENKKELVIFCNNELTKLQMAHTISVYKPARGSTFVYSDHDFVAARTKHPGALFIIDEADLFIQEHFLSFGLNAVNGLYALIG